MDPLLVALGGSWGTLGCSWNALGLFLATLWALLGALGAVLERSWDALGTFLVNLGRAWVNSQPSGPSRGVPEPVFTRCLNDFRVIFLMKPRSVKHPLANTPQLRGGLCEAHGIE